MVTRADRLPPLDQHLDLPRDAPEVETVGLLDVWALLMRRKGVLLFGILAGIALAVAYYFVATPEYEADAEILVTEKDTRLPTQAQTAPEQAVRADQLLSTHIQIFRSPRIIGEAIEARNLRDLASIQQAVREEVDPVEYITEHLTVTKGGDGQAKEAQVLRAAFRSPSPQDAALILDALIESYQKFLGETFKDVSNEAVDLIASLKDDLAEELQQKEEAFRTFRENSPLLWKGEESSNLHQTRLEDIETELALVRSKRLQAQSRLEVIEEALQRPDAEELTELEKLALLSEDDVRRLELLVNATRGHQYASEVFLSQQPVRSEVARAQAERILSLRLEEERQKAQYGPGHPRVKEVQDQIREAERFLQTLEIPLTAPKQRDQQMALADLVSTHTGLLRHDVQELQKREAALLQLSRQEESAAKDLVSFELRGETMRDALERTKQVYNTVLERLGEMNLIRDYGGYITEIIAPVKTPTEPAAPKLLLVLALGGVLGVFLGGGLAYVADLTDRTFHSPVEVRHATGLAILGQLPLLQLRKKRFAKPTSRNGQPSPLDHSLVAYHHPRSRSAEAVRGLRTALHFNARRFDLKTVQITSPCPGDGKSTLAANLAISAAQSGKKVLLIDADLRKPRVHALFGLRQEHGLVDLLIKDAEIPDVLHHSPVPGLDVIPSGSPPPNPAELLTLATFDELLATLREEYDLILVDSPPVLSVSDPVVIAPRVDGVLLTVRITKNGRPDVLRARGTLGELGANILGVVVNDKDRDRTYGYGGYGYGQEYGYGYGEAYGAKDDGYLDQPDQPEEPAEPQPAAPHAHDTTQQPAATQTKPRKTRTPDEPTTESRYGDQEPR